MMSASKDCEPKCRSTSHAAELLIAVSKGTTEQVKAFVSRCCNGGTIRDTLGRTALHVAASCGKWEVVEWLLEEKGAELNAKDTESEWTALHRSLFYGQLNSARRLIAVSRLSFLFFNIVALSLDNILLLKNET